MSEEVEALILGRSLVAEIAAKVGNEALASLCGCRMEIAFADVRNLSSYAASQGQEAPFWGWMLSGLQRDSALAVLCQLSQQPGDRRALHKAIVACREGRSPRPAFAAFQFRETLRDGFTLEQAMKIHADLIAECAAEGDLTLTRAIDAARKTIRRAPDAMTRSAEGWLRRAWLPLALWSCDPETAENRVACTYTVLQAEGVWFRERPTGRAFDKLFREVRSNLKTFRP